jgi:hypothetical protein
MNNLYKKEVEVWKVRIRMGPYQKVTDPTKCKKFNTQYRYI